MLVDGMVHDMLSVTAVRIQVCRPVVVLAGRKIAEHAASYVLATGGELALVYDLRTCRDAIKTLLRPRPKVPWPFTAYLDPTSRSEYYWNRMNEKAQWEFPTHPFDLEYFNRSDTLYVFWDTENIIPHSAKHVLMMDSILKTITTSGTTIEVVAVVSNGNRTPQEDALSLIGRLGWLTALVMVEKPGALDSKIIQLIASRRQELLNWSHKPRTSWCIITSDSDFDKMMQGASAHTFAMIGLRSKRFKNDSSDHFFALEDLMLALGLNISWPDDPVMTASRPPKAVVEVPQMTRQRWSHNLRPQ